MKPRAKKSTTPAKKPAASKSKKAAKTKKTSKPTLKKAGTMTRTAKVKLFLTTVSFKTKKLILKFLFIFYEGGKSLHKKIKQKVKMNAENFYEIII